MRILVSAYACSPYQGSEASVGWGFISELSKFHELVVFVEEEKFRKDIEKYLNQNKAELRSVKFIFVRKKRNRFLRKLWPPSYYRYYKKWHKDVYKIAKKLQSQSNFDIAHQLTMVGFREPGYLWKLNIPFVWGPVGGMGYFPYRFIAKLGLKGFIYYLAYNFFNFYQMNFLRRPKLAAKKAGIGLIAATSENKRYLKSKMSCNSTVITEVGCPEYTYATSNNENNNKPFRIVWSGKHLPRKALHIGIHSLSMMPKNINWELHILGNGELFDQWKRYAKSMGIIKSCVFHGSIEREKALNVMQNADIALITSLRELTSTVTVESLSLGLPVVCLDHCGFSDVIDETCGIKVPVTNFSKVTNDLSNALYKLSTDKELLKKLSEGALKQASSFTWAKKVNILNQIYCDKLNDISDQH